MPFTFEVLKQFVITRVIPPIAGALTSLILVKWHFLGLFHFGADETAKAITEGLAGLVGWGAAWAAAHFSLKGHYMKGKVGPDLGGVPEVAE